MLERLFIPAAAKVWNEVGWRGALAVLLAYFLLRLFVEGTNLVLTRLEEANVLQPPHQRRLALGRAALAGWRSTQRFRLLIGINVALLLVAANVQAPYLLYVLIKTLTAVSCIYLCYVSIDRYLTVWPWLLGTTAVLFNPILPIRIGRTDWFYLNLLAGLIVAAFFCSQFWAGFRNSVRNPVQP